MKNKKLDRRDLLRFGSAGLVAGGLSAMAGPAAARGLRLPPNPNRKMIVIWQRGANDGLNTLVPYQDSHYYTLRPNLGIPQGQLQDINGFCGLHPSMQRAYDFDQAQSLALVHQVGYPNHSRSHFESMQNIETTKHYNPGFTHGMVARMASILNPSLTCPVFSASVSTAMQMTFNGLPSQPVIPSIGSYKLDPHTTPNPNYAKLLGTAPTSGIAGSFARAHTPSHQWDNLARSTGTALVDGLNTIGALGTYVPDTSWTTYPYPSNATELAAEGLPYSPGYAAFFRRLRDSMQILKETCAQVTGLEIGGWDTHGDQLVEQGDLLQILAHGLRTAMEDASGTPGTFWDDLVVVVVTEFGRTSNENQSGGTDHGNGALWMATGGRINGGAYNCDPGTWTVGPGGTTEDVAITPNGPWMISHKLDYRTFFAEILWRHFGITVRADIDFIIDDYSNQVPNAPFAGLF